MVDKSYSISQAFHPDNYRTGDITPYQLEAKTS